MREYRSAEFLASLAGEEGSHHLDADFELVRDTFRRFAEDKVRPVAEHVHRQNDDIPEDVIAGLAELGTFGLSIPEEYGGFSTGGEGELLAMVIATEELSRGSLGVGGSLITRPEILARALVQGATEAQKREWLPRLASGDVMAAVAVTEPDFGSDSGAIKTTATRDGDDYVINGVKTWCTFAGRADALMLMARTDPDRNLAHHGLSLFIVPKERAAGHGFRFDQPDGGRMEGRAIDTLGYRGMHSYEVSFDGWRVPAANLIGGEAGLGQGFYMQMTGFDNGRVQTAARALGVMQAAYEAARDYARDRIVFGRPVADYQLTQVKLARMAVVIQADAAVHVRRRSSPGQAHRRGRAGGRHGQGLRVPRRRVGHARGDAAARWHGLRGGVRRQPLLRRRAGAVDLRGGRRDPRPQGHRPPPDRRAPGGPAATRDRGLQPVAVDEGLTGARSPGGRHRVWDAAAVNESVRPVLVGAAAGLLLLLLPAGAAFVVVIAGALLAGWLLPRAPMKAAVLFIVPTAVMGIVRLVTDDESDVGALIVALVVSTILAAILTHVGAGIALRRQDVS